MGEEGKMIVKYELGNILEEADMTSFKILFLHLGPYLKIRRLPLFS
jgi:hypothetical protein